MIIISLLIPILLILQRCEIGSLYFFAIFFAAGILVPAAWLIFLFIIIPIYYSKNLKMTYQITSAAFISKTDKKLQFKWNEFTGFWVSEHERCKGRKILNLYYRKFGHQQKVFKVFFRHWEGLSIRCMQSFDMHWTAMSPFHEQAVSRGNTKLRSHAKKEEPLVQTTGQVLFGTDWLWLMRYHEEHRSGHVGTGWSCTSMFHLLE